MEWMRNEWFREWSILSVSGIWDTFCESLYFVHFLLLICRNQCYQCCTTSSQLNHINSYPLILYVSYNNIKNSREIFLKRINEQMKQMNNEILITIERVLIE